jgi:hypothetical protein
MPEPAQPEGQGQQEDSEDQRIHADPEHDGERAGAGRKQDERGLIVKSLGLSIY